MTDEEGVQGGEPVITTVPSDAVPVSVIPATVSDDTSSAVEASPMPTVTIDGAVQEVPQEIQSVPAGAVTQTESTVPAPATTSDPVQSSPPTPPITPTPPAPGPAPTPVQSSHPAGHFGRYSVHEAQDMAKHAHEVIFEHKADKIFAFIQKKGSITHHQTMDLLHVSRPMAYLYLWRLKRAGALVATKKGKEVRYTLTGGTL